LIADTFHTKLEVCYEILLYLSSRMAKLAPGTVLEFISSDPEAGEKIAEWCEMRGHMLLDATLLDDGQQRFLIQKSGEHG